MPEIEVSNSNSFVQKTNWLKYNLEVSAYEKEIKGDLLGAIKDLSLAITDEAIDYDLFYERGINYFKTKNYKEAIEDLVVFIKADYKHHRYRDHIKALFLYDYAIAILNKNFISKVRFIFFKSYSAKKNSKKLIRIYLEFLNGVEETLERNFKEALFHFQKIN